MKSDMPTEGKYFLHSEFLGAVFSTLGALLSELEGRGAIGLLVGARGIIAGLLEQDPDNKQWQRDLALFDSRIAAVPR